MINQFQVSILIHNELPDLNNLKIDGQLSGGTISACTAIQQFSDYTHNAIQEGHIKKVKYCFALAERLYWNGDGVVRRLIETEFAHSLAVYLACVQNQGSLWRDMMPKQLYILFSQHQSSNAS